MSESDGAYVTREVVILENKFFIREDNIESTSVNSDFFNPSFTVAAQTGNYVWEGCWVFIEYLQDCLGKEIKGKKIIELGSGTGLLGLALASYGASVVCTDLEPIVNGVLQANIDNNSSPLLCDDGGRFVGQNNGTIVAHALDWTIDLESQLHSWNSGNINNGFECDYVFAAETVWLDELITPFVNTFISLLMKASSKKGYFEFLDRSVSDTTVFASIENLFSQFRLRNCAVEKLFSKLSRQKPQQNESENGKASKLAHVYLISLH